MALTLSSTSTQAEIEAAYDDSLDYDISGDTDKCKQFIQAARMLVRRISSEITKGDATVREDYQRFTREIKDAVAWLNAKSTTSNPNAGNVRYLSVEEFRS